MTRKISQAGLELIKRHEQCRREAYRDLAGVWTIGWGHTGIDVHEGDVWSQSLCDSTLDRDLMTAEWVVESSCQAPLNDNQFSALVSFVFNVGAGNFRRSSVLSYLQQREYLDACRALALYTKVRVQGTLINSMELSRRRQEEQSLFMASMPEHVPA